MPDVKDYAWPPMDSRKVIGKRSILQTQLENLAGRMVCDINFVKYLQGKGACPGAGFHAGCASWSS